MQSAVANQAKQLYLYNVFSKQLDRSREGEAVMWKQFDGPARSEQTLERNNALNAGRMLLAEVASTSPRGKPK
jgi:hypothetical protein